MTDRPLDMLKEVRGIGDSALENFQEAGFDNLEDLKGLSRSELKDVQGVGSSTANSIIRLLEREGLRRKKPRTENQEKLQDLLRELFQFDNSELDFGIYRIMNQKRDEIEEFINSQLLDVVDEEFEKYESENVRKLEEEVEELREEIKENFGEDAIDENDEVIDMYKGTPLGEEYTQKREELKEVEVSEPMEAQIFNDLYNFFKHYYEDGDFITKRRYSRKNKYAIPYNGEEVYFHWANKEQYYVKTAERFKDYRFRLPDDYYVQFELKNAEIDQNNAKGDKKYFLLHSNDPINYDSENKTLHVQFEYRPLTDLDMDDYGLSDSSRKNTKADKIREEIIERIMEAVEDKKLLREALEHTEKGEEKTILKKNLYQYTKKHTSDYFIHKNLGDFLRRELDFYIKNEIVHLDDLGSAKEKDVEQYMGRVRIVKKIANKIIDFLEQIENLQKKLWEKKKFVVQTDYCITLDKIPEEYYSEILDNDEQINEWKELYKFEESMKGSIEQIVGENEIDENFLRNHQSMMIDTKFFDEEFKDELLSEFDKLDDEINGVLIKTENWQGLNLIKDKYREKIDYTYIDPPFNTGPTEILYKNNYRDSSWLSLMKNRVELSKHLLNNDAVYTVAIDDYELAHLCELLDQNFNQFDRNVVIVNHHPQGSGGENISRTHEYSIFLTPKGEAILKGKKKDQKIEKRPFMRSGTGENNLRSGRPNSFYAILVDPSTYQIEGIEPPPELDENYPEGKTDEGLLRIYPKGKDGTERAWRRSYESALKELERNNLVSSDNGTIYIKIDHTGKRKPVYSNWTDKRYNAGTYGTDLLYNIFSSRAKFSYPKSLYTVMDSIEYSTHHKPNGVILDFFAGSGTTAHATIELNNKDGGNRKYVLLEMAEYFDETLLPRIIKIIFSKEWNDGLPVNEQKENSHMFKYLYLEQYEDALNNLRFKLTTGLKAFQESEEYMLNYMLEFETKESPSLLDIDQLKRPFKYKLKIKEEDETKNKTIDIPETFNYLIGLEVSKRYTKENSDRKYLIYRGKVDDEFTIVIWRNTEEIDLDEDKDFISNEIIKGYEENIYINQKNVIEDSIPIEKIFKNNMGG